MVSWSLDTKGRIVLGAGVDWDDPAVRREVRADARVLADRLGHPIMVIDPADPMPWRVAEVVEPTRSLGPTTMRTAHEDDRAEMMGEDETR